IKDNRPFVRARVMQVNAKVAEGNFEFDIGQVGALTLGESFTSKNELLKFTRKTLQISTGSILVGRTNAQIGRIQRLQLGPFIISTLIENAPATEVALHIGDTITAIDGTSTGQMTLEQIRHMFRQEGRRYSLSIKRNESVLPIKIKTRRLI